MFGARRAVFLFSPLLAPAVLSCGTTVEGGGAGGASSTAITSATGTPDGPFSIVYQEAKVVLRISTAPLSCAAPHSPNPSACDWIDAEIRIPAELLAVGAIDLGATFGVEVEVTYAPDGPKSACIAVGYVSGGGSGSFLGILDITEVNPDTVTFTLSGAESYPGDPSLNGTYVAPRCP